MSLSGSLFNGVSGLQTAQRQINVTSANVSNANVEGYSQKTAAAVTRLVDGQNSGVEVGAIRREVDAYLDSEAMRARTELGRLDTRSDYLNRVSEMFGTLSNDSTLANGLNDLSGALEALSVEPESASVRRDVVEAADALARQFNRISNGTVDLRVEASNEIDQGVAAVNDALESVAELNDEISRAEALGRPTADLRDERDRQLDTLSDWMNISTFSRENGQIAVMGKMSDGSTKMLVDSRALQFDFAPDNGLSAGGGDGNIPALSGVASPTPSDELGADTGGKLGALLEVRDTTLTDFHRDIDRLAQTVRDRVNAAHNQGTVGNTGVATIEGSVDTTAESNIVNVTSNSPPNPPTITLHQTNGDGEVVESLVVDLNSSYSNSADLANFIDNATGTDSAGNPALVSSLGIDVDIAPDGGLRFQQTNTGEGMTLDTSNVRVSGDFTVSGTTKSLSHYYGLNNLFETPGLPLDSTDPLTDVKGAAGQIQVSDDILTDPNRLSRGTASNQIGASDVAEGDNSIAQAMAAAFEARDTIAASGGNLGNVDTTMSGYAADILSFQASETSRTETARDFQQTMYDELKFRADSKSGVNVDEELSNMLVFEQAYNASARVISTVQQMFDTLDRMMN